MNRPNPTLRKELRCVRFRNSRWGNIFWMIYTVTIRNSYIQLQYIVFNLLAPCLDYITLHNYMPTCLVNDLDESLNSNCVSQTILQAEVWAILQMEIIQIIFLILVFVMILYINLWDSLITTTAGHKNISSTQLQHKQLTYTSNTNQTTTRNNKQNIQKQINKSTASATNTRNISN